MAEPTARQPAGWMSQCHTNHHLNTAHTHAHMSLILYIHNSLCSATHSVMLLLQSLPQHVLCDGPVRHTMAAYHRLVLTPLCTLNPLQVNYLGEDCVFSPEQVTAMLLSQLKKTTEDAIGSKVTDVVVSVPSYFTDPQRRAFLDAVETAGLNCLRLMNDTTASECKRGGKHAQLVELSNYIH